MGNCLFPKRHTRVQPAVPENTVNTVNTEEPVKRDYQHFVVVKKRPMAPCEYDDFYDNIITEHSRQYLVDKVEKEFQEKDIKLAVGLIGVRCRTWKAVEQDHISREEARILKQLKEEGILNSPQKKSSGGVSYDLGKGLDTLTSRPAKFMDGNQTRGLTEEEINLKHEMAEKRRQERQEMKMLKLKKSRDIEPRMRREMERQRERGEFRRKKMENVAENREQKLEEIRSRMRERQKHREKVKLAKEINLDDLDF